RQSICSRESSGRLLTLSSFPTRRSSDLKSWVHLTSPDLVHWKNLGLAINADTKYDSHGAYSGSVRVIDDKLFLMYTGNHRSKERSEEHTSELQSRFELVCRLVLEKTNER